MAQYGTTNVSTNAIKYSVLCQTDKTGVNTFINVTPSSFITDMAVGLFPANCGAVDGEAQSPGWVLVQQGTGPIVSISVGNDGASYANLAVGGLSNGTTNSVFSVTVNSIGKVQTVVLVSAGKGYINTAAVGLINPANGIDAVTIVDGGLDYANAEVITFSNGAVNAIGTLTTNSLGGITAVTFSSGGRGFSNTLNTVVAIATANGDENASITPTIRTGAGLVVASVLGGRSGRITYETLAVVKGMVGGSTLPGA